jgi:hypothetical protein
MPRLYFVQGPYRTKYRSVSMSIATLDWAMRVPMNSQPGAGWTAVAFVMVVSGAAPSNP